ncbi:hypothetical protein K7640_03170 [Micromonospora sp. PLK6-60]|uniref:hypothetical protein n=1 Tax=Micromonospora sp. PLK6-60 TaxID=2873383 RepID=UPI001CA79FB4|nr:hypothetical protein [Micromonospora sp. PLK6-60]MBY8870844.1 hypothetical protein [Micromonospora sp. PLK6-60]
MSCRQPQPVSRRRRPSALLLALGLLLGLAVPTALTAPASARSAALAGDPLCVTNGYSIPPGVGHPVAVTWSNVGARTTAGYDYRYWMKQELTGSTWYYASSLVAKCSGGTLISSATIPTTDGFGTVACTSSVDRFPTTSDAERYVGQAVSWDRAYLYRITFRYWQREWYSVATLRWTYGSSFVVRC